MAEPAASDPLLPEELRALLPSRTLRLRRPIKGRRAGMHPFRRAGSGVDFWDHRPYLPGDELRIIDHRASARRDRYIVRRREANETLDLLLVLDDRAGMGYGEGRLRKSAVARAMAMALATLAVRQGDAVGLLCGRDGRVHDELARPRAGRRRLGTLADALATARPSGSCPWPELLDHLVVRAPRQGLIVMLSDFVELGPPSAADHAITESDQAWMTGVAGLAARGHEVVLAQILHRDEIDPPLRTHELVELIDLDHRRLAIEGTAHGLLEDYRGRVDAYLAWLVDECHAAGVRHRRLVSDQPLAEGFLGLLAELATGARAIETHT